MGRLLSGPKGGVPLEEAPGKTEGEGAKVKEAKVEEKPIEDVDQLISDLQVLIELGACSTWAAGPDRVVNPLALDAVYHRAPGDDADDGVESPFPKWPIDLDHIEIAHEYALKDGSNQRLLTTDAGPIVYSPPLVRGL